MADPYGLLCGLILEEGGQEWGTLAHEFQRRDARAVIDGRRSFLVRPRGASKTSDGAAIGLALLLAEAPSRSRSYLYAADADQAAEVLDVITGIVRWTPGLPDAVKIEKSRLTVNATEATITVESSDAASAFSRRPFMLIADELTSWPQTTNHKTLWDSAVSAMGKVPGSRLLVLSMAGSPISYWREAWEKAESSPDWYTSHLDGPTPWWTEEDVRVARDMLTDAAFRRYILAEWTQTEESLGDPEDVLACVRQGPAVLESKLGASYVVTLDLGVRRDLTAAVVAHGEQSKAGRVIVIDRVTWWRPSKTSRVDLIDVEAAVLRLCREYRAPLRFDRSQAEQMSQNLTRQGVRVREYVFSQSGANRAAKALYTSLRDRSVEIPDDPELISELQSVRLTETGPSTVKMINPAGTHDDLAVAVGMAIVHLHDAEPAGPIKVHAPAGGSVTLESGVTIPRRSRNLLGRRPAADRPADPGRQDYEAVLSEFGRKAIGAPRFRDTGSFRQVTRDPRRPGSRPGWGQNR